MDSINRLLKNDGIIFIQIPDIKNSFYSLMGDQCYVFTRTSLINVLGHYDYISDDISNDYFPGAVLVVARKNKSTGLVNCAEDDLFVNNIKNIKRFKEQLESIYFQNIAVFGTTVNAAFVEEIMGERVLYFLDENPSKIGRPFRGKNVLHPKEISENNHIILPYGKLGKKIRERIFFVCGSTFSVI
jgi:hypothetical protein